MIKLRYVVIIPARYNSTRFPGKPLVEIAGKTMIQRVYEKCLQAVDSKLIYVATDSQEIENHCLSNKIQCILTSEICLTGTDRIGEVAQKLDADYYINVQGDEPLFNPKDINLLIDVVTENENTYEVFCGYCKINHPDRFFSLDIPKVIFNSSEELIYMSRSPIPGNKNGQFNFGFRQVCAYAFSKKSLLSFSNKENKSLLEEQEDIELLRFIEMGYRVKMIKMSEDSISVDKPEDIERVIEQLK